MDRHDRLGLRSDLPKHLLRIHVERIPFHIHRYRNTAGMNHRVDRGAERHRRDDHLISRFQSDSQATQVQSRRAGVHGHGMANSLVFADQAFEFGHFGARSQPRRAHTTDHLIDFGLFDEGLTKDQISLAHDQLIPREVIFRDWRSKT